MMGGNRTQTLIDDAEENHQRRGKLQKMASTLSYQRIVSVLLISFLSTSLFVVDPTQSISEKYLLYRIHRLHYTGFQPRNSGFVGWSWRKSQHGFQSFYELQQQYNPGVNEPEGLMRHTDGPNESRNQLTRASCETLAQETGIMEARTQTLKDGECKHDDNVDKDIHVEDKESERDPE